VNIASMTGYGEADAHGLRCELRSVNHRSLDLRFRLPEGWAVFESAISAELRKVAQRGALTLSIKAPGPLRGSLDYAALKARKALWLEACDELGRSEEAPMTWLLSGVFDGSPALPKTEQVLALVAEAMQNWNAERLREGGRLEQHLRSVVAEMRDLLAAVEAREGIANHEYSERLRQRMNDILQAQAVDEVRLLQEVSLMAERRDIAEERVRIGAHLDALAQRLDGGGAVGRSLGFLSQELLREVNTIGSKAQDLALAERVIALKSCIEQLREQLLNLE
jgi:uncharacterized protein YicC (UPF0701 family)